MESCRRRTTGRETTVEVEAEDEVEDGLEMEQLQHWPTAETVTVTTETVAAAATGATVWLVGSRAVAVRRPRPL